MSVTQQLRYWTTELTFTNDNVYPGLIDQVHRETPYLYVMANKARPGGGIVFESDGEFLRFDIIQATNNNTKAIDGWDTIEPVPTDEATAAFEIWATNATPIAIPLTTILKNSGENGIRKIAPGKYQIAAMAHQTELHRQLVAGKVGTTGTNPTRRFQQGGGTAGTDDRMLLPLGFLLQKECNRSDAVAVTNADVIHGKDQTVDTYFQNQSVLSAAGTFAAFKKEMRRTKHLCAFGSTNDAPDLGLATLDYYELLQAAIDPLRQYQDVASAQIEFESIVLGPTTFYIDYKVPDWGATYTDAVTLTPNAARGSCFFLNTNWIRLVVHEMAYIQPLPWNVAQNRLGITSSIVTMASHQVLQRRKQGIHFGVTASTITS